MKNYIQPGEVVTVAAPRTLAAGEGVAIGTLAGVALTDATSGNPVEIALSGVFTLAKTSAEAWATVGLPVYMIPATGVVTSTAGTGRVFVGVNLATAINPSATGLVRLNGSMPVAVTA